MNRRSRPTCCQIHATRAAEADHLFQTRCSSRAGTTKLNTIRHKLGLALSHRGDSKYANKKLVTT